MSSPQLGGDFMVIDGSSPSKPSEGHDAWEMVMEPISQVRQALEIIKHVCTMSGTVCLNKRQCKRIADRFCAIGEGMKGLGRDKDFNAGSASDGSKQKVYPAFDELLTVLRKGEALVSSYVDSKGIISVVSRTENRESFQEIHDELDILKAQFDFEGFSEPGQVREFESSSGVVRKNALAEDADQDLSEMPEDMAQIKDSKNMTGLDMEKATEVVLGMCRQGEVQWENLLVVAESGRIATSKQGNEQARDQEESSGTEETHDSSVWGVRGGSGFQQSDSALSVPEHLRIQPDELEKMRRIGKGTSAIVYEATWLGCTVAVKVFKNPSTPSDIRALQQEVDFLINLGRHPCVAKMVGLSVDSNQRCSIVMELMDGSLNDLIQSRMSNRTPGIAKLKKGRLECVVVPFELHEALPIISKIALGMAFLHSQGVVHRDLKSRNVLANEHAESIDVKLMDFGESLHELESPGQNSYLGVGTGFWRAPELFPGGDSSKKPDLKAADVYSFAMTCYEVFTGQKPFSHLPPTEYTRVIKGERPPLPARLHPGLKALVKKCWDHDPNKRPEFGEIIRVLNYITLEKPVVVLNKFSGKDMVLNLLKKVSQVHGAFTGLLGMVWQGKEPAIDDTSSDSSEWGVEGKGGFERSDIALSVPEHLRIHPDKLERVRCIGKGAFAEVYEATWLGCTVAVKVFQYTPTPSLIRALQQEVDFLINLGRHPCVVQMVGLSVDSNQRCSIVMELMDGSLYDLIQSRMSNRTPGIAKLKKGRLECVVVPFELHEALPIIFKIALGMAFLHSQGVVHRDLKSRNVLANEHAESIDVKLADFGMSLHELESPGHEGSYLRAGTGFWRAPELLRGGDSSKKPDLKAVDVYSFAMTCYEVFTGQKPFSHLPPTEYTRVIKGERPPLPADLHPGLKALVQRCWHTDPVKRPNFTEICEGLLEIRQSLSS